MKQTYLEPQIKLADLEAEQLLITSFDINEDNTNDQWSKFDDDSESIWD